MRWTGALLLVAAWAVGACGGEGDGAGDAASRADLHRHDACIAFLDAVDAADEAGKGDEAAERHAAAVADAREAAELDDRFDAFAEAIERAEPGTADRASAVEVFTACGAEARSRE